MAERIDVFLAVGHGITPTGADDPGAVCAKDGKAVTEAAEALKVTKVAVAELNKRGFRVRSEVKAAMSNHDPNHVGSVAKARDLRPHISIEVHFDWSGAPRGGFPLVNEGRLLSRRMGDRITEEYRKRDLPRRPMMLKSGFNFPDNAPGKALIWESDAVCKTRKGDHEQMGLALAKGIERSLPRRARRRARKVRES